MKESYEIPKMDIVQVLGDAVVITSLNESDSTLSETREGAGSLWGN